jgi:hypothetical protein
VIIREHRYSQSVIHILIGLEDEESGLGHDEEEEEDLYGSLSTGLKVNDDGGLIL